MTQDGGVEIRFDQEPPKRSGRTLLWIGVFVLIFLAVGYGVWKRFSQVGTAALVTTTINQWAKDRGLSVSWKSFRQDEQSGAAVFDEFVVVDPKQGVNATVAQLTLVKARLGDIDLKNLGAIGSNVAFDRLEMQNGRIVSTGSGSPVLTFAKFAWDGGQIRQHLTGGLDLLADRAVVENVALSEDRNKANALAAPRIDLTGFALTGWKAPEKKPGAEDVEVFKAQAEAFIQALAFSQFSISDIALTTPDLAGNLKRVAVEGVNKGVVKKLELADLRFTPAQTDKPGLRLGGYTAEDFPVSFDWSRWTPKGRWTLRDLVVTQAGRELLAVPGAKGSHKSTSPEVVEFIYDFNGRLTLPQEELLQALPQNLAVKFQKPIEIVGDGAFIQDGGKKSVEAKHFRVGAQNLGALNLGLALEGVPFGKDLERCQNEPQTCFDNLWLKRFSLDFSDEGLTEILFAAAARKEKTSVDALRSQVIAQLDRSNLGPFQRPDFTKALADLAAFLRSPGAYGLTITAKHPAPIGQFRNNPQAGAMTALDVYVVESRHTPKLR